MLFLKAQGLDMPNSPRTSLSDSGAAPHFIICPSQMFTWIREKIHPLSLISSIDFYNNKSEKDK